MLLLNGAVERCCCQSALKLRLVVVWHSKLDGVMMTEEMVMAATNRVKHFPRSRRAVL